MTSKHSYAFAKPIITQFFTTNCLQTIAGLTSTDLNSLYDLLLWEQSDIDEPRHKANLLKWIRRNLPELNLPQGERFAAAALIRKSMAERDPLPAASTEKEEGAGRGTDKLEKKENQKKKTERKEKEKMEKEELDWDVTMADAHHEGEELVYEHGGGMFIQSEDETEAEPIAQERDFLHEITASSRNNTPKSEKVVASSRFAKQARRAAGEETGAALRALAEGVRGHTPRVSWMDSSSSSSSSKKKKKKNSVLPPQLSSKVPVNPQPAWKQGYTATTTSAPLLISPPSTPAPPLLIPSSPTSLFIPPNTPTTTPTTFTTEALHRAFVTAETLWRERDFVRCVVEISRAMVLVVPFVTDESRFPRNGVEEDERRHEHQREHEHEHGVDEGQWEDNLEEGEWEDVEDLGA